jgi:hypothetical protein
VLAGLFRAGLAGAERETMNAGAKPVEVVPPPDHCRRSEGDRAAKYGAAQTGPHAAPAPWICNCLFRGPGRGFACLFAKLPAQLPSLPQLGNALLLAGVGLLRVVVSVA